MTSLHSPTFSAQACRDAWSMLMSVVANAQLCICRCATALYCSSHSSPTLNAYSREPKHFIAPSSPKLPAPQRHP